MRLFVRKRPTSVKLNKKRKEVRGNDSSLVLQKVKTEAGRKTFAFQGALIHNKLTELIRTETSFKNSLVIHEGNTK